MRPTRIRAKPVRFHISPPEYVKNVPDFRPKSLAQDISGHMLLRPTRVRAKPGGFWTQTFDEGHFRGVCNMPLHGCTKNPAGFTFPNKDAPKTRPVLGANRRRRTFSGRMQYAPTRVRAKFDGFHISAHGYAKNAPDFTLPNRDTPKTRPVLHPNLRRGLFRGVCFCAPTRIHEKPGGFHISQ